MSTVEQSSIDRGCGTSPPSKKPKITFGGGDTSSNQISINSDNNSIETSNMEVINGSSGINGISSNIQQNQGVDEGLYSRQLFVYGHEAMLKMAKSNVLISGIGGLGVEIAKNVCLGGVKSVTLHDTKVTTWNDLSSQFYLKECDVGKNRAQVSLEQLSQLNSYVPISIITEELGINSLKDIQVVVIADRFESMAQVHEIATYCHEQDIAFILAETRGVFSRLFCDFGKLFKVFDVNGEAPITAMIASITNEEKGVVSCLDESRHGFEDGDLVEFKEIEGMTELNNRVAQISVTGPFTFTIGDTRGYSIHTKGGIVTQVKQPKNITFKSFADSLDEPEFLISDFAKFDYPEQLHIGFLALDEYFEKHQRYPRPYHQQDANELIEEARKINARESFSKKVESLNEKLLRLFSFVSCGNLCPMNAFLGGVVGQEVMKACSGKFMPIQQWMYFDSIECLPLFQLDEPFDVNPMDYAPSGNRYDGNIAVFGKDFQNKLGNLKYFIVGSGAIGCELLKNFAMMGVACSEKGELYITDMDLIERSNLNRQFLFRQSNIGEAKSLCAASAAKKMNPNFNVIPQENFVGATTEHIYTDEFFEKLDGVANALDNVNARQYVDRRCVYYRKPLLESGTLGTKGNTQVILPFLTESYSSSQDPPEKEIPICTLKNFPNAIEHTIQWARDLFEGVFKDSAKSASDYLSDPNFIGNIRKRGSGQSVQDLESVKRCLSDRPQNMEDCVKWARLLWEENFNNQIRQLLYNFPADQETATGQLFWSGPKRCPHPLQFNSSNTEERKYIDDFIYAASNLRAEMYGIPQVRDREVIKQFADQIHVPHFQPRSGVTIHTSDTEAQNHMNINPDVNQLEELINSLPEGSSLANVKIRPIEFEKDDDTNFHIDFVAATSNCRALNYDITPADRLKTKFIAGKIIPAVATTTSVVGGLISLELYKLAFEYKNIDIYKNGFINLALPFFGFSTPVLAQKKKFYDTEWTLWDRFEVEGPLTLEEYLKYFEEKHKISITMLSQGVCMLYSFFMPKDRLSERLKLPIEEVARKVSRQPLPAHVRALVFEIMGNDEGGEDVEVPYVRYKLRRDQSN